MSINIVSDNSAADEELSLRVRAALARHHVPSLRRVQIETRGGDIQLSGSVPSFHARQLLQHTVRLVAGGRNVIDQVRVLPPSRLVDPIRLRHVATAGLLLLSALSLAGCSKSQAGDLTVHPVKGQVWFDGKPAGEALVVLHRQGGGEFPAPRGRTDSQGNFEVTTYTAADGAPAGEYSVTVELRSLIKQGAEFVVGPSAIPAKYNDPKASQIVCRVADGENQLPILLAR